MDNDEKFRRAIDFSLKWEGGRNFNIVNGRPVVKGTAKNDLGGATAYGIIISTLKAAYSAGIVSHQDICKLTQEEAKLIYRKNFWDKYGWEQLEWPVLFTARERHTTRLSSETIPNRRYFVRAGSDALMRWQNLQG